MKKRVILGVSASLRNARFGKGSERLIDEVSSISDKDALTDYLEEQSKIITDEFFEAGRKDGLPFGEIYEKLKKRRGDRGLSNSESAVVCALWGAQCEDCDISHISLSKYFPPSGELRNLDELKEQILTADGIIIGGPVYFGDRGSLAQEFIEYLGRDKEVRNHIKNKVYGGVAVGAKRNGGQETTLIYQLVDMTNLNMLGVGNDSETTSQYGGTAVAGDVGTLHKDAYGINTCIGTGRRVASVVKSLARAEEKELRDQLNVDVWVLQDTDEGKVEQYFDLVKSNLSEEIAASCNFRIRNLFKSTVRRCIACDICPTKMGEADEYRCVVSAKDDLFCREHGNLISTDAVLLAAYSPRERSEIHSIYQKFIERTRYWRRDNYVIGDLLMAPFVMSEVGANQNLHIRMLTSGVRHHSVMHSPLVGYEHDGGLLNTTDLVKSLTDFVEQGIRLTRGRLNSVAQAKDHKYNPVGYVISKEKQDSDSETNEWAAIRDKRRQRLLDEASARLK